MTVALPRMRMDLPEFVAWWDGQTTDERFVHDVLIDLSPQGLSLSIEELIG